MSDHRYPKLSTPTTRPGAAPAYYIPGCVRRKMLVVAFGALLAAAGLSQMWTPLTLLFRGKRATAEATRVIKIGPGGDEIVLTNDTEIQARQETRDRRSIFWNEFRFQDSTGADFAVRAPVGGELKPLFPLIDEDGLPTTLLIHYDPRHPSIVSFPTLFSTWFAPGLLAGVGAGLALMGSILLYWSKKPIEWPHVGDE